MDQVLNNVRSRYLAGEPTEALALCAEHVKSGAPVGPHLQLLHGILQVLEGESAEGEANLRAVIQIPPATTDWASDLALGHFLTRDFQASKALLEEIVAGPDADGVAYGRLGATFLALDDQAAAKEAYREAVRREPGRAEWHHNLAVALVREQHLEEALENLDAALRLKPDLSAAQASRQRVLISLERAEEAVAQMEEQVRKSPEDAGLRLHLARLLELDQRPQEAAGQLREASKLDEESLAPYLEVAGLFQRWGMRPQALKALKRAESKDPEALPVLDAVAKAQNEMGHHKAAMATVEKGLELHPDARQLKFTRALIYNESDDFDTAEKELRALLEVYPGDGALLSTLGLTLMWVGRIDEAIECFEQAAKINPMALAHMVTARALPEDPAAVERMERFAANTLLPDDVRAAMGFALAELWQKRKDYDKAFTHVNEANRLAHKTIVYDHKTFSQQVAAIMKIFSADFFEARKDFGDPSERPVFVCGMPRSGTTLVEQILSSHPEIHGAGELPLMPTIVRLMPRALQVNKPYPIGMRRINNAIAKGAAKYYLGNLDLIDKDARFVVDKMPHNFLYLGLIALMFPNAKIIHLQRDPRDVAVSNYFQNFKTRHGMLGYAFDLADMGHHLNDHARLMAHWHEVLPVEIYECNYEELVQDQARKTAELLQFVGVDWDEDVLAFHKTERAVRTASVWQVRQPMYQTSAQKWRRYEQFLGPLDEVLLEPPAPQVRTQSSG
ncbi:MAG: sulfotransferase [Pseudomonadota bacterium]